MTPTKQMKWFWDICFSTFQGLIRPNNQIGRFPFAHLREKAAKKVTALT
jgi:hypothetical protein